MLDHNLVRATPIIAQHKKKTEAFRQIKGVRTLLSLFRIGRRKRKYFTSCKTKKNLNIYIEK